MGTPSICSARWWFPIHDLHCRTAHGRAYALELARRGAAVVVNDTGRTDDGRFCADAVVDEIRAAGGQAAASHASVATMTGGQKIVWKAVDRFGRLVCPICHGFGKGGVHRPYPKIHCSRGDPGTV